MFIKDSAKVDYQALIKAMGTRNNMYLGSSLIRELRKLWSGKTLDFPDDMLALLDFIGEVDEILEDLGYQNNQGVKFKELRHSVKFNLVRLNNPKMNNPINRYD